jgi:radical SAM superfamily enzyme YgiQ (UPF0313 family)
MKILLITPPFYRIIGFYNRYFPVGITTLGTFLQHAGHEVTVYDADYNANPLHMDYTLLPQSYRSYLNSFRDDRHPVWREVRDVIAGARPDLIGISIWTTYAASAFHVARLSKEIHPTGTVVMGGPHATVKADEILSISPHVDYVIRGDGEIPMLETAKHLCSEPPSVTLVAGLSFRNGGDIVHNPSVTPSQDITVLPFPDRSLLMHEDKYSAEDMGLIMTSRGCPYDCSYCATHTRRVSYRPIENIISEINYVKNKYGTTLFSFKDDSFTVNKKRVEQFCDMLIEGKLGIQWECNTRVDLIDPVLLGKMKKAGCVSMKVGIESGSERILTKMNKHITLEQIRKTAEIFSASGIFWTGYFLMGIPGESLDEIRQTLDLMRQIKPDFASISVYEPFPGTDMFREGIEKGLVRPAMSLEDFYTLLPNDYYKRDPQRQVETIGSLEFQSLANEIKDQFHRYNKNVKRLWRRAKSRLALYICNPKTLVCDFKKYLSWR